MPSLAYTLPTMRNDSDTKTGDPHADLRFELQRRRERLRLTPPESAARAGLSAEAWRNIERGYRNKTLESLGKYVQPRRANLINMARAVDWDPDEALAMAGYSPMSPGEREQSPLDLSTEADTAETASGRPVSSEHDSLVVGLLRVALLLPAQELGALVAAGQAMALRLLSGPANPAGSGGHWSAGSSPVRRDVVDGDRGGAGTAGTWGAAPPS